MKPTEDQLKAALALALPEKLRSYPFGPPYGTQVLWLDHNEGTYQVTNHEWPTIVGMVEAGLTVSQRIQYRKAIVTILFGASDRAIPDWDLLTAKWPVRAQALADSRAIIVEA